MKIQTIAFLGGVVWGGVAGYALPYAINQSAANNKETSAHRLHQTHAKTFLRTNRGKP